MGEEGEKKRVVFRERPRYEYVQDLGRGELVVGRMGERHRRERERRDEQQERMSMSDVQLSSRDSPPRARSVLRRVSEAMKESSICSPRPMPRSV